MTDRVFLELFDSRNHLIKAMEMAHPGGPVPSAIVIEMGVFTLRSSTGNIWRYKETFALWFDRNAFKPDLRAH